MGASLDSIRFDFDPVRSARKRNLVLIEKALARWVGQNTSLAPSVAPLLTEARSTLASRYMYHISAQGEKKAGSNRTTSKHRKKRIYSSLPHDLILEHCKRRRSGTSTSISSFYNAVLLAKRNLFFPIPQTPTTLGRCAVMLHAIMIVCMCHITSLDELTLPTSLRRSVR